MATENNQVSINLIEMLTRLKRYWAVIILCGFVLGIGGFVYSNFFVTPQYAASCRMIVTTREDANNNVTTDQLTSAQQMINTYSEILLGRDYLEQIIDNLNLKMTHQQLKAKISISAAVDTQIMEISVRDTNLKQADRIARYIYQTGPAVAKEIVKIGSLDPAGSVYAVNDGSPISPNVKRTTVMGFLVGCVLPMAAVVLVMLFDNTYKTDVELRNDLGLPVLGVIPSIDSVTDAKASDKGKKVR